MTYSCYEIDNNVPITNASVQELLDDYATNDDIAAVNQSISNLNTAMAAKANKQHDHAITDVDNLDQTLQSKLNVSQLTDLSITKYNINNMYSVYTNDDNQLIIKYGVNTIATYDPACSSWSANGTYSSSTSDNQSDTNTGNSYFLDSFTGTESGYDNKMKLKLGHTEILHHYAEIATTDNNNNSAIILSQYKNEFTNLKHQATLLDQDGNTEFPVQVTTPKLTIGDYTLSQVDNHLLIKHGNTTIANYYPPESGIEEDYVPLVGDGQQSSGSSNIDLGDLYSIYVDTYNNLIIKYQDTIIKQYNVNNEEWYEGGTGVVRIADWNYMNNLLINYKYQINATDDRLHLMSYNINDHSSEKDIITVGSGGDAVKIYGYYRYSRLTVSYDSYTSYPAVFGYDNDAQSCFIKLKEQACELNVYNNRVVVTGSISADNISNSMTILHKAPITEPIENYQLGYPVFSSGTVYKYDPKTDTYSTSTNNKDCIPSVKSTGTYREYLGIIVAINTTTETVSTTDGDVIATHSVPTVEFATHGDYYFYVNNSSNYHLGDVLTFDGNIIADDTNINVKIMTSIVGKVTAIIDEHTVAVFKSF